MITEKNIETLDSFVAKYAMMDYKRANPKPKFRNEMPVHNPYTLSPDTNEAREMLHLARKTDITKEEEESVKAYLLKKKLIGENN